MSQSLVLGRRERRAKLYIQGPLASSQKSQIKGPHGKANGFSRASFQKTTPPPPGSTAIMVRGRSLRIVQSIKTLKLHWPTIHVVLGRSRKTNLKQEWKTT